MNQDLKKPPSSGGTGSICGKTGLYKATDGKLESVLLIKKGDPFPPFVGANGTTATVWYTVGSTDASRTTFESVKVSAGTI